MALVQRIFNKSTASGLVNGGDRLLVVIRPQVRVGVQRLRRGAWPRRRCTTVKEHPRNAAEGGCTRR